MQMTQISGKIGKLIQVPRLKMPMVRLSKVASQSQTVVQAQVLNRYRYGYLYISQNILNKRQVPNNLKIFAAKRYHN